MKGKLIIVGIVIILIVIVIGWNINNVQQKEAEANTALAEYIQSLEEVYGSDRANWPKCHLDAIAYSQTHPLIRLIQYGTTEMPDFCGTRSSN
jgi:hypothetical protein